MGDFMAKNKVKDKEFAGMQKVHSDAAKYVTSDFHFYLSYGSRVALIFVGVILLGILSFYCFNKSFSKGNKESLKYTEKISVDTNVEFLDNAQADNVNMDTYLAQYVDTVIDTIKYELITEDEVDVSYSYTMDFTVENTNTETKKVDSNTYQLLEKAITDSVKNTKSLHFNADAQLDYDYHNGKAIEKEKLSGSKYAGNMIVKMYLTIKVNYSKFAKAVTKDEVIEIRVPLLTDKVTSTLVSEPKVSSEFIEEAKPELINEPMLYSGVALIIIDTIFLLSGISFFFRATPKKSKYAKLRDGLLSEYGSIIVNVRKMPNVKGKNIMDCYSFGELLDAQKILDKPIIFYEIVKDQKCTFFIVGEQDIYEYTLKECDIEF